MSAPRRPALGLNTVCFLEDLSLKMVCASSSWCRCGLMSSNLFSFFLFTQQKKPLTPSPYPPFSPPHLPSPLHTAIADQPTPIFGLHLWIVLGVSASALFLLSKPIQTPNLNPHIVYGCVGTEVSHLGWGHWFTLRELEAATDGFAPKNVVITLKLLSRSCLTIVVGQAEKEFEVKVEVEAIRKVGHKNLLRLLGYCAERAHSLLLVDYRSLVHLFSYRCQKMWSADCRRFTSEKTNNTLVWMSYCRYSKICNRGESVVGMVTRWSIVGKGEGTHLQKLL
ncbi:putative non-specific serine/threonine protein kinase [Helianthus anomalus]